MQIYKTLETKEKVLRGVLLDAGITYKAIDKIVDKTDLNKIDTNNTDLLKEQIKESFGGLIIDRRK